MFSPMSTLSSKPDSYPHVTNGGEEQDERPQAAFAKRASLSRWFAIQEAHHGSVPDSHPGGRLPSEIRADRHGSRRPATTLSQDRQHERLNHLMSRALWVFPSQRPHLQQAHGQRRQQTKQAYQAVNRWQLPFLNATPAFETLVIVLHEPTRPIPVYPLPCLFERRGGDRGQQKPFQRLLSFWGLLFPDTNDPHGQGFLAHSWLLTWGQERHLPKAQLQLRRTCLVTM